MDYFAGYMIEAFDITVDYKGKLWQFEARLETYGYTHRFVVHVEGTEVNFERDEEGHYRAVLPFDKREALPALDKSLLQAIAQTIEEG